MRSSPKFSLHSLLATTLAIFLPSIAFALPIQISNNPVLDDQITLDEALNPVSIQEALGNFSSTGDVRYLAPLAPPQASANAKEKALFALSLAVKGSNGEALRWLTSVPKGQAQLLTSLVNAQVAKNERDWGKARGYLNSAREQNPRHPYVYLLAGQIHYAELRLEQAKSSFQQALLFNPNLAVAESNLAATFFIEGNKERALALYESALAKRPFFCPALHGSALIKIEQNDLDTAERRLQSCLSVSPDFRQARLVLADIAIEKNRPEDAIGLVRNLEGIKPLRIRQQSNLMLGKIDELSSDLSQSTPGESVALDYINSLVYAFTGEYDKATSLLNTVEEKTGDSRLSDDLSYSIALLSGGRKPETKNHNNSGNIAAFLAALTSESASSLITDKEWYNGIILKELSSPENILMAESEAGKLGLSLVLMNERATALAYQKLNDADSASSGNVLVQYLLARQLRALGQTGDAEKLLQKVLSKEPDFFSANVLAADIAAAKSEFNDALNYLEAANKAYKAPGVVLKLGILNERLGRISETESYYRELIELIPESHIAYNQLAWFYASHEMKLGEALKLAEEAIEIMPGNISTMDTLGWLHHLRSDNIQALKWLDKADDAAGGTHAGIKYRKAKVLSELGQKEKALTTIAELLASGHQASKYRKDALELKRDLEQL